MLMASFGELSQNFLGGTGKKYEKPYSGYSVIQSRSCPDKSPYIE
jgi:hypothetical protein